MKVSIAVAKNKLAMLIKAAEDGEPVTICRHGKPIVDLVRTSVRLHGKPRFGTLKDKVVVYDADWWKPMTGKEFERGRDFHRKNARTY